MKWKQSVILGMKAWQRNFGGWSFLILKDSAGYICSYKEGNKLSVLFHEDKEYTSLGDPAPRDFYYYALEAAMDACELKYEDLLK